MNMFIKKVLKLINGILSVGWKSGEPVRRLKLVRLHNISSFIAIFYFLILGISVWQQNHGTLAFADFCFTALFSINVFVFFRYRKIELAIVVFVLLLGFAFIYLIITGGEKGTGPFWSITFPIVSLQLLGSKKGNIFSFVFTAIQVLLLFVFVRESWMYSYNRIFNIDYEVFFFRLLLVQSALHIHSYFFAKSREELYDDIIEINKAKNNLFINLAHETKTPLTLIQNYLNRYIKEQKKSHDLDVIKQNIDKLQRNIVNFLDMEKLEKGIIFYDHNQLVNVSDFLNEKIEMFKLMASNMKIRIESNIENEIFTIIDPFALDRIVNNILGNAVKYNKVNGLINVTLKSFGNKMHLTVNDRGIGISEDELENIFKPYYQISKQKRNIQGIGMGLNIVKKILNEVHGEISVKSKLDEGSSFIICLTRKTGRETLNISNNLYSKPIDEVSTYDFKTGSFINERETLFVVEDNLEMLRFLIENLESKYNVIFAHNGEDALQVLDESPMPNLILSDVMMDAMDGFEFCELVKTREKYKAVPIIFLTAKTSQADKIKGLNLGAIDFISKPFAIEELLVKIDSLLTHQKVRETGAARDMVKKIDSLLKGELSDEEITNGDKKNLYKLYYDFGISRKEIEVIDLLKQGLEYKEIADKLGVSINTVETYRRRLFQKCGVQNKVELINLFR